jgi:hypothetical protein
VPAIFLSLIIAGTRWPGILNFYPPQTHPPEHEVYLHREFIYLYKWIFTGFYFSSNLVQGVVIIDDGFFENPQELMPKHSYFLLVKNNFWCFL